MDYELDLEIDENALDVEWLSQPLLAMKWGEYWAECQATLQRAEEKVKIIRAELIAEVTGDPSHFLGKGIKATGPTIEAYYRNHDDHKDAKEKVIKAQLAVNIAEIAKKEMSVGRKDSLKNLVELLKVNYFESPVEPRDLTHEAIKKRNQKTADEGVAKKLKRRKVQK